MKESLEKAVEKSYSRPITSPKDCTDLAKEIYKTTNRTISEASLRRFFGLLKSKSNLSQYNLDTLALFSGFLGYDGFRASTTENLNGELLGASFKKINTYTLNSIQRKSLTPFYQTIERIGLSKDLNNFLESNSLIFVLAAPSGYGKSIAMAHWVGGLINKTSSVLFIQAPILSSYIKDSNHDASINLDLDSNHNVFERLFIDKTDKKIIIVVDAFEDLGYSLNELEELGSYLVQLAHKYSNKLRLKIILSLHTITWEKLKIVFEAYSAKNMTSSLTNKIVLKNISQLTNEELRKCIELFNERANNPILMEFILSDLLELLRNPFNLYLFTKIHASKSRNRRLESTGYNQLLELYFKQEVFMAKHAEEKEDIIWAIITNLNYTNKPFLEKKGLKRTYPIHLKRESNYYAAYSQLLTSGIIEEERVVNKYGLYTTIIRFNHSNYYYYLVAIDLIQKNNGLGNNIFKHILSQEKEFVWKVNSITTIFEIAYNAEEYKVLENFCNLPNEIHEAFQTRFTVGSALRRESTIKNRLILQFAKSSKGQKYYIEQFVDTNYLFNYTPRIKVYLDYKKTKEARLFGNTILFLAGFLKLDTIDSLDKLTKINSISIDSNIHPWPIGRKLASNFFYQGFISDGELTNPSSFIKDHFDITYQRSASDTEGLISFELPILVPLILLGEYRILGDLLSRSANREFLSKPQSDFFSFLSKNQNIIPTLVLEFVRYKQKKKYRANFYLEIESALINQSNSYDDFIYQIVLRWILFDYYSHNHDIKKAEYHYSSALQLSKFAGYDFFVLFLQINATQITKQEIEKIQNQIESKGFLASSFLRNN